MERLPTRSSQGDHWKKLKEDSEEKILQMEEVVGDGALGRKVRDPKQLPTREEIILYFCPKNHSSIGMQRNAIATMGGFFENRFVLEILTQEYVDAFAVYLHDRIRQLGLSVHDVVLEVGAGQGRLSFFLAKKLKEIGEGLEVIAVDSHVDQITPAFPVRRMDSRTALELYQPKIVISSWMPKAQDWTPDFRAIPGLQEYILIGSPDITGGIETWGNEDDDEGQAPEFTKDGFEKIELVKLSALQIAATDLISEQGGSSSMTVSFRRA